MSGEFLLKRWDVTVPRFGTGVQVAATRGKALAAAWRSDVFCDVTFGEFIRHARARRAPEPPRFGDRIQVMGRDAYFLGENGQYVQFCYPDETEHFVSHPLDVTPESYRPRAYR